MVEQGQGSSLISEVDPVPNAGPFMDLLRTSDEEGEKKALDQVNAILIEPPSTQNVGFDITILVPEHGYCNQETKVLIVGDFQEHFSHLSQFDLYCSIGGKCVKAQLIRPGVLLAMLPQNTPGDADLYITLENQTRISQVITFKYLPLPDHHTDIQNPNLKNRLLRLVCSSNANSLLDVVLRKKVEEWVKEWLKKVQSHGPWNMLLDGPEKMPLDNEGQGVIHLSAMLDYDWAISMFAEAGPALNFRDSEGRTALHWAAYYGRTKIVAGLLSAGADPCLEMHDSDHSTAADLAAKQGFQGLAVYLAERSLKAHLKAHLKAMIDHDNIHSDMSSGSASISKLADYLQKGKEKEPFEDVCMAAQEVGHKILAALGKIDMKRKKIEKVGGEDESLKEGREQADERITRWMQMVQAFQSSANAKSEYEAILALELT